LIARGQHLLKQSKAAKERMIENHLRLYNTYKIGIVNSEKQLEYIMPNLVTQYGVERTGAAFFVIGNDKTANGALDRIEGKRALDLKEEIEKFKMITTSIENALQDLKQQEQDFVQWRYFECLPMQEVKTKLGYSEEKSVYRIRRHTLEKLLISLHNLLVF
jgi:DNA-directed RNA polymerase specialized sigma subunit